MLGSGEHKTGERYPASERWKPQRSTFHQERRLKRHLLKSPLTGGQNSEQNELLPLNTSARREFTFMDVEVAPDQNVTDDCGNSQLQTFMAAG